MCAPIQRLDRSWINMWCEFIIGFLIFSFHGATGDKEYYCTETETWPAAMTTCLKSGGVPLTYADIVNNTQFTLRNNITVWTADYIYAEEVKYISTGLIQDYECGYMVFSLDRSRSDQFYPKHGVQYGSCTDNRIFYCDAQTSNRLQYGNATWIRALQSCISPFKLWTGYRFISGYDRNGAEIWVNALRRITQTVIKYEDNQDGKTILNCGTNNKEVSRANTNSCNDILPSICVIDGKMNASGNFSQACFQEKTTPTTTTPAAVTKDTSHLENNTATSEDNTGPRNKTTLVLIFTIVTAAIVSGVVIGIVTYLICRKRRRQQDEKHYVMQYSKETYSTAETSVCSNDKSPTIENNNMQDVVDGAYEMCDSFNAKDDANLQYQEVERDDGIVYSHPKHTNSQGSALKQKDVDDSFYDTTSSAKAFHESANIYNKLGMDKPESESVYDVSGQFNENKTTTVNIYNELNADGEPVYNYNKNSKKTPNESTSIYNRLGQGDNESVYDHTGPQNTNNNLANKTNNYNPSINEDGVYNTTADFTVSKSSHDSHERVYGNLGYVDDQQTYGLRNKTTLVLIFTIVTAAIVSGVVIGIVTYLICRKRRRQQDEKHYAMQYSKETYSTAETSICSNDKSPTIENNNMQDVVDGAYEMCDSFNAKDDANLQYQEVERDDEIVYSHPKHINNQGSALKQKDVDDSFYDTTSSAKAFHESANIYNKLGMDKPESESVYDVSGQFNENKTTTVNIYNELNADGEPVYNYNKNSKKTPNESTNIYNRLGQGDNESVYDHTGPQNTNNNLANKTNNYNPSINEDGVYNTTADFTVSKSSHDSHERVYGNLGYNDDQQTYSNLVTN